MRTYQRGVFVVLAILSLCTSSFSMYDGKQNASNTEMEARGLIVKLGSQVRVSVQRNAVGDVVTGLPEIDRLHARWQVTRMDKIVKAAQDGSGHPFERYYVIEAEGSPNYKQMMSDYGQLGSMETVELDYVFELAEVPNDPLFEYQVNLHNTGQLHPVVVRIDGDYNDYLTWVSGLAGADINAYDALSSPPDNTGTVVVAIIDSGVDLDHPDLMEHIWTNYHEVDGNGIDDDHNGYPDDVVGWDFDGSSSDNDPTDELGHGSHCAGIVTGVTNNNIGIAGICPDVQLMALRTSLLTSDNVAAIVYAADNGADVISMSWGGVVLVYQVALGEAMNYARAKGVTLCAAAGNMGIEWDHYPSCSPATISVGASTDQDQLAGFSTYNLCQDIVAPGVDILSLRADNTDIYAGGYEPNVHIIEDYYYLMSGTSMACPGVAGVAAYLIAVSPGLTPDQCKEIMCQTAHDIVDPYGEGLNLPGWDKYTGWGRVDLGQALLAVPRLTSEITSPWPNQVLTGASVNIVGTAEGDGFQSYVLEYGAGWNPSEWIEIETSSSPVSEGILGTWNIESLVGHHTIRLRVGDDHFSMTTVFIGSTATADIISPADGDALTGVTDIVGSVYGVQLDHWVLEYQALGGYLWTELASSGQPVDTGLLYAWVDDNLANGTYTIRLSMYSAVGLEASDEVTVYKNDSRPPDWLVDLGSFAGVAPNYGDFDGDGQQEIVIGTETGVKVLNTDGTLKTAGMPQFPVGDFRAIVSVGNLDGDDIDDMVALRFDIGGVYGFTSSAGNFVIPVDSWLLQRFTPLFKTFRYYVILHDTDKDGIDEMYVRICYDYSNDGYCILPLEADDTSVGQIWYGITDFVVADLDNNGDDELYGYNILTNEVQELSGSGSVLDQFGLMQGTVAEAFRCRGISAYDIDGDTKLELIVSGYFYQGQASDRFDYSFEDVRIFAFDEGLSLKEGWPHRTDVSATFYPSHPVFGDINSDGRLEYFVTCWDLGESFIKGWHVDGTPYDFTWRSSLKIDSCWTCPPLLADINGDGETDIIAAAMETFMNPRNNILIAWDNAGNLLPDFPITFPGAAIGSADFIEPIVGDIDNDGKVDLTVPVLKNQLAHFEFDADFNYCASPVTTWRYDRSKSGIGPSFGSECGHEYACGDADGDGEVVPLDAVYLVSWFWGGGPPPVSIPAIDVDGSGGVDPLDAIYFVNWMWRGGPGLQCP